MLGYLIWLAMMLHMSFVSPWRQAGRGVQVMPAISVANQLPLASPVGNTLPVQLAPGYCIATGPHSGVCAN